MLYDPKSVVVSSKMVISWKEVKGSEHLQFCEVAIQATQDARVIATDEVVR